MLAATYRAFWNASLKHLREADRVHDFVKERDHTLALRPARLPEETTTINFVRRIAVTAPRAVVVLHTRNLEGGRNSNGNKSKADLELSIKFAPRRYLNLILQAKSLRAPTRRGSSAFYKGWSSADNTVLTDWAIDHNQTPGMLLYNVGPYLATGGPTPFGACPIASPLKDHYLRSSRSIRNGTPGGISMVTDAGALTLKEPSLDDIRRVHFPIEHLFHNPRHHWKGPSEELSGKLSASMPEHLQPLEKDDVTEASGLFEEIGGIASVFIDASSDDTRETDFFADYSS